MPSMIPSILFLLRQIKSIKPMLISTSQQTEVESAEVAPPYHCSQDQMIQVQGGLLSKIIKMIEKLKPIMTDSKGNTGFISQYCSVFLYEWIREIYAGQRYLGSSSDMIIPLCSFSGL